jgi:hypothetical protein
MKDSSGFFRLKGLPGKKTNLDVDCVGFPEEVRCRFHVLRGFAPRTEWIEKGKADSAGEECRRAGITTGA